MTTTIPSKIRDLINAGKLTTEEWERIAEANRKEALPADQRRNTDRVRLDDAFDTVIIHIREDEHGWWVEGYGYYRTARGPRVQGQKSRHFPKERDARDHANREVEKYQRNGLSINPHRDDIA